VALAARRMPHHAGSASRHRVLAWFRLPRAWLARGLEFEDLVTVRDAVAVVQRLEMVRRIADEISGYVVELGTDGRLLALQLDELMAGIDSDRTLVIRDYLPTGRKARTMHEALILLDLLTATEI
jgi:diadenylate cyclase